MKFLKKAKDVMPVTSLKFLAHNYLSGAEPERPLSTLHASELTKAEGFCPRYYALSDVLDAKPGKRFLSAADHVTFRMGRDLQDQVVEIFADMKRVMGDWVCLACEHMVEFCDRPETCEKCGCTAFKPEEVRFTSEVSGASGGVDMIVRAGGKKLKLVEIKSMIKDQFADLMAPLAEHRSRTQFYLRLVEESNHPMKHLIDTSVAKVLYVCKGGYKADPQLKAWGLPDQYSPFKEYDVKRNDAASDDITRRAKAVKDFREGKAGMPCGICPTAMFKRALRCPRKTECFSGDYPAENDWKQP